MKKAQKWCKNIDELGYEVAELEAMNKDRNRGRQLLLDKLRSEAEEELVRDPNCIIEAVVNITMSWKGMKKALLYNVWTGEAKGFGKDNTDALRVTFYSANNSYKDQLPIASPPNTIEMI
jgi:hypothetical protein